jgi:putative (di)nucleoside polyphosphate hydrolase
VSKPLDYRPAAAVMLLNAANKVFVAQRLDSSLDAWQMPQGGLDPGEDARAGALRELEEETSISSALVEFIAQSSKELFYDLPPDLVGKLWTGRYAGQRQHWFLMRFLGIDTDVDLMTKHPEFRTFQWVDPWLLPELIVPFKRSLYEAVLAEFAQYLPAREY